MVPEPNLVVPDHLPLSKSVVDMATHAFKEACLGEFMAAVQVRVRVRVRVRVKVRSSCVCVCVCVCRNLDCTMHMLMLAITNQPTKPFL